MAKGIYPRQTDQMVGLRFGSLVVACRATSSHPTRNYFWRCVCDCGAESVVRGTHLRLGKTKSCGCKRRDECESRVAAKNPNWKGDAPVHVQTGRVRARRALPGPLVCSVAECGRPAERHHKDGITTNNDPSNIEFLCHKHHMGLAETRAAMRAGWARRRELLHG